MPLCNVQKSLRIGARSIAIAVVRGIEKAKRCLTKTLICLPKMAIIVRCSVPWSDHGEIEEMETIWGTIPCEEF